MAVCECVCSGEGNPQAALGGDPLAAEPAARRQARARVDLRPARRDEPRLARHARHHHARQLHLDHRQLRRRKHVVSASYVCV